MTIYRGDGGGGNATSDAEVAALVAYQSAAANSAAEAAASAAAADVSEANASSSASAAATSASNASTSASNASTSASNASTSASNASTSATNASNSASDAAASAASIDPATLVKLTGDQTIAGVKTFSSTIAGSINGNAGTATTAGNVTGTVAIANGGTGQTSASAARTALGSGAVGDALFIAATVAAAKAATPIVSGTAVASTSGTSIDFTAIPSWVKRITVNFSGLSTNGTSNPMLQIGDAGGIETTGYSGSAGYTENAGSTNVSTNSAGFQLSSAWAAANAIHGRVVLELLDAATYLWVATVVGGYSTSATLLHGGGSKALSATLDRIRLTTVGGTNTFDAGSVNILYE